MGSGPCSEMTADVAAVVVAVFCHLCLRRLRRVSVAPPSSAFIGTRAAGGGATPRSSGGGRAGSFLTSVPVPALHALAGSATAPSSVHTIGGTGFSQPTSTWSRKTFSQRRSFWHSRKQAWSVVLLGADRRKPSSGLEAVVWPFPG